MTVLMFMPVISVRTISSVSVLRSRIVTMALENFDSVSDMSYRRLNKARAIAFCVSALSLPVPIRRRAMSRTSKIENG